MRQSLVTGMGASRGSGSPGSCPSPQSLEAQEWSEVFPTQAPFSESSRPTWAHRVSWGKMGFPGPQDPPQALCSLRLPSGAGVALH